PFGMVQLSPDTRLRGQASCGGYYHPDSSIIGFSHTHLSGVGEPEFRDILFMPTVGELRTVPGTAESPSVGYRSSFSHENETARPGYYAVMLEDYQVKAELTATLRCGFHKYTFPETDSAHILIDLLHPDGAEEVYIKRVNDLEIEGLRRSHGWAWDQHVYFVARFSKPFSLSEHAATDSLNAGIAALNFSTAEGEVVLAKVGISSVGTEGARKNLDAEIPGWDFEEIKKRAEKSWNRALGKIDIKGGSLQQRTIFYTSLYHAFLSPALFMDADSLYRGMDQKIHRADGFTNYSVFSLWDTFRGLHPLFTILEQRRTGDFINSLLTKYKQGGRLPMWPLAANYTDDMLGYHAVPVIVDAFVKGIRDFDTDLAYEAIKHSAGLDRLGLEDYRTLGYIPYDRQGESVSKTLEYCYDDWCISQMAEELGEKQDYRRFLRRAHFYENVFDSSTNFMRGRGSDRRWLEPFDPLNNSAYSEGNAYQYLFVPHDMDGVKRLMGGEEALSTWLDELFSAGQYQHGNEPSHHLAYLYTYTGEAWKTQKLVSQILSGAYAAGPEGLAGNEDCGQMSAWYILSATGFYPVTPGQGIYAIGRPLFDRTVIHLENGKRFRVKAVNNSPENIYIQSATLNGAPFSRSYISHDEIMKGSTLVFRMGPAPNKEWGKQPGDRPRSDNGGAVVSLPYVVTGETLFQDSTVISLACDTEGAEIRFSLDGTSPAENAAPYRSPLSIHKSVKIRMLALRDGMIPSYEVETDFIKSSLKEAHTPKKLIPGLKYRYYERFFVTTADLERSTPVTTGIVDGFNLSMARKDSYFGVWHRGYVKVPEDGIYSFFLESNDGSRLFINGEGLIENDGNHAAIEKRGSVGLKKGLHGIELKYFQCGGGKELKISWTGPGFSKRDLKPSDLFYEPDR
ncbi:MAG: GH92 family glycosyl hydrolase, partial [Bacteroidota bacterium]